MNSVPANPGRGVIRQNGKTPLPEGGTVGKRNTLGQGMSCHKAESVSSVIPTQIGTQERLAPVSSVSVRCISKTLEAKPC